MIRVKTSWADIFTRLQGCAVVMKSFFMRFNAMSHTVDQGETIRLLIEALGTLYGR